MKEYEELVKAVRWCADKILCVDLSTGEQCPRFKYREICKQKQQMHEAADAIERLQAEVEELTAKVPRWIPVTERLPDFHEEVLIYAIGKEDGFSPVVAISEIYIFRLLPFSNGTIEWRDPWDFFSKNYEVTHWMRLPELPEVKA